jgi:hypothetical protein
MNKSEVQQRVLQNGVPLSLDKFEWDEKTNIFSTNESNLVLNFSGINGVTFKTGFNCTFKTGNNCIFKTDSYCTFDTHSYCTFDTGDDCTFDTSYNCTFKTGSDCVIVRRDIFEVIQPEENQQIVLNSYLAEGYQVIKPHVITIDGKNIELSEKSFNQLKKSLLNS